MRTQSTPESRRANARVKSAEAKRKGKLTNGPATGERYYSPEETEFLMAVKSYQERTGIRFPSNCELLAVLKTLGYRKPC